MWRVRRITVPCSVIMLALLTSSIADAKETPDPAPAPIPMQIVIGKKVFISNGESSAEPAVPNLTYNAFYALMKSWGRYELVAAPVDADLVFEIRFVALSGKERSVNGVGGPEDETQIHLLILDPKTHVVLWAFTEHVQGANLDETARKNFDQAMAYIVDDLKKLTRTAAASGTAANK